nr:TetR/AcrR family transcriptional regulator [Romboutsia lituseburensis]
MFKVSKEIAYREGISGINMRKVASQCELSLGTIYNYYTTKVDIIFDIIEDLWNECFDEIDKIYNSKEGFFKQTEFLYFHTLQYLSKFENNWIKDLIILTSNDKEKAKERECELVEKFTQILKHLIEINKKDLNIEVFNKFSEDKILEFISYEFFIMLKRLENDYSFFDYTLKKILL